MASYPTNKERTNYARLCRAVVDLCTDVLRTILYSITNPRHLKNRIRKCPTTMSPQQLACINKAFAGCSYRDFDISMLYYFIRLLSVQDFRDTLDAQISPSQVYTAVHNCPALISDPGTKLNPGHLNEVKLASTRKSYHQCKDGLLQILYVHLCPPNPNILHPTKLWGESPDQSSFSLCDDIERIRLLRNAVYGHITTTEVSDVDFNKHWTELEDIMARMNTHLGGHYKEDLDDIKSSCMDEETEKKYCDDIKQLTDNEKKIKEEISNIYKTTGDLQSSLAGAHTDITSLKQGSSEMETEITSLRQGTSKFFATTETEMKTLKKSVHNSRKRTSKSLVKVKANTKKLRMDIVEHIRNVEEGLVEKTDTLATKIEEKNNYREKSNTEEQTLETIRHHKTSGTFITTIAVIDGKSKLEENGILIYTGLSGDGKTENAVDIMDSYLQYHPDWCFLILTDICQWSVVNPVWPPTEEDQKRIREHQVKLSDINSMKTKCHRKDIYPMTKPVRGRVLIINNINFNSETEGVSLSYRKGSQHDEDDLTDLFKQLHFDVKSFKDLTAQTMVQTAEKIAKDEQDTPADCFVCVIMSHGCKEGIYGVDGKLVQLKTLISFFDSEHCPALSGKPKIFFVQACRTNKVKESNRTDGDGLDEVQHDASKAEVPMVHPAADFLTAYATPEGCQAYRHTGIGSWFLQAVVWTFKYYAHSCDILDLLTKVNNIVSTGKAINKKGVHVTISGYRSYLKKKLFFFPGIVDNNS